MGPGPGIHPSAGGESRRVLAVGLANGRALAGLLRETGLRLTLLEADAMLVRAALARWPELAQARADGRLTIVGGPERWALARLDGVFDLVLLGDGWSDAPIRTRALSHRPDHRWTVEAFKVCLERLKPDGLLRVQRTGRAARDRPDR